MGKNFSREIKLVNLAKYKLFVKIFSPMFADMANCIWHIYWVWYTCYISLANNFICIVYQKYLLQNFPMCIVWFLLIEKTKWSEIFYTYIQVKSELRLKFKQLAMLWRHYYQLYPQLHQGLPYRLPGQVTPYQPCWIIAKDSSMLQTSRSNKTTRLTHVQLINNKTFHSLQDSIHSIWPGIHKLMCIANLT